MMKVSYSFRGMYVHRHLVSWTQKRDTTLATTQYKSICLFFFATISIDYSI